MDPMWQNHYGEAAPEVYQASSAVRDAFDDLFSDLYEGQAQEPGQLPPQYALYILQHSPTRQGFFWKMVDGIGGEPGVLYHRPTPVLAYRRPQEPRHQVNGWLWLNHIFALWLTRVSPEEGGQEVICRWSATGDQFPDLPTEFWLPTVRAEQWLLRELRRTPIPQMLELVRDYTWIYPDAIAPLVREQVRG